VVLAPGSHYPSGKRKIPLVTVDGDEWTAFLDEPAVSRVSLINNGVCH